MLGGLFSKKVKGLTAIFDIKQGSVGGAFVLFRAGEKPLVRYAHRISYRSSGVPSQETDSTHLIKTLRLLAERLCTHGLPKILKEDPGCRGVDRVVAFLGVPWVSTRLIDYPILSEKPISVTDKWLKNTLEKALENPEQKDSLIVEQSVLRAHLNGYRTNDPHNKSAKRVDLSLFEASVSNSFAKLVQEALESSFHIREVSLRSSLLASFTAVRDHFESEDNFLLITVGSEVTEIAVVRDDALIVTDVLAQGSHTLIEAAAARLHTVPEEVPSRLKLQLEHSAAEDPKQIQSDLALLQTEWQQAFDGVLTKLRTVHGLPRTVFLSASHSTRPWFAKLLGSSGMSAHTLTREPFRVIELDGQELLQYHHIHAEVTPDSPLSLETLFLHKLSVEGR